MRTVDSRAGFAMPVVGQGTWRMGERAQQRRREIAALRLGIDLGMTLIDTAEMYADGGAEEVVAEAITGRREEVFLVSKVLPSNASHAGTLRAAEHSLRRLRTDHIDLYLLHWPGPHPLAETYRAFRELQEQGKIRHYGVSNFDLDEMRRSEALAAGGGVAANQVLYNLERRGIERGLLPWCRQRAVTVMAYSPLQQARLGRSRSLSRLARRREVSPWALAVAWAIRQPGVVTIPKASAPEHVRENAAAAALRLGDDELAELDRDFAPSPNDEPLEML